ncbi:hybrid sensor histidine kinase/response regulator [Kiritimatiellaeota bacterium B1221]|nr:hybrid sensor histidine kinase/response regulator [Kiritimatiellaeota bacterium B1221]
MDTISSIPPPPPEKRKVLIIDDELGPRESMRILLKEEYQVRCEDRVEKGLRALEEYQPDAIVMDIRMPEIDGIEGLRRIREMDKVVSVIMLTGYGTLETARSAIRLGANDYLKKPFDTVEMMRVIADNIRRTDFTRRKDETERNLHNLTEALMTELEEKRNMAKLGQASRELAHDLSNPLTVVISSVDLLARELKNVEDSLRSSDRSESAMEYITVIEEGLERCTELLGVWRNLEKNNDLELSPCNVFSFLSKIGRETEAMIGERKIKLNFFIDGLEDVEIQADTLQLHRTIINLLSNAIDAVSPDDGEVTLKTEMLSNGIGIEISDNGPGIPPELTQKVFEPYFTTKEEGKGTGLGLFISQRIVERHGGTLRLQNSSEKGACFQIELPYSS